MGHDISNNNITNAAFLQSARAGVAQDHSNNQITGAAFLGTVGLDWHFSGAAETMNTAPLTVDTPQQPLLTTPQHA